eukprot:1159018-Pelagomonas_calceolata.AAC.4
MAVLAVQGTMRVLWERRWPAVGRQCRQRRVASPANPCTNNCTQAQSCICPCRGGPCQWRRCCCWMGGGEEEGVGTCVGSAAAAADMQAGVLVWGLPGGCVQQMR